MTRVSSFGHNQAMINGLLRNQQQLMETQQQINTGKKANDYAGLSREVSPLIGAQTEKARTDQYIAAVEEVTGKLDFNDLHLTRMYDETKSLRSTILDGMAAGEFSAFDEKLQQTFESVISALNAKVGGDFLFGGTRSDTKPVTINSLSDLIALPNASDAFQNGRIKPSAKVDDGVTVEYGMLAEEIGTDVLASLKRIADYQDTNGPIEGKLTAAERSFLETELGNIKSALEGLTSKTVENGIRTNQVKEIQGRHESAETFLKTFISDIEDVDIAEAISRLKQNQVALEGSLRVMSQLSRVSLLDYI